MRDHLPPLVLLLLLLLARCAAADSVASNGSSSIAQEECGRKCQAEQREALVQLYQRLNGPNWLRQLGWLSSEHHCRWQGVVCCLPGGQTVTDTLEAPNNSSDIELVGELLLLWIEEVFDVCVCFVRVGAAAAAFRGIGCRRRRRRRRRR